MRKTKPGRAPRFQRTPPVAAKRGRNVRRFSPSRINEEQTEAPRRGCSRQRLGWETILGPPAKHELAFRQTPPGPDRSRRDHGCFRGSEASHFQELVQRIRNKLKANGCETRIEAGCFLLFSDHPPLHAQVPTPRARHQEGLQQRAVPQQAHPRRGGGQDLQLPGDRLHHRHGLPEPAGTSWLTPARELTLLALALVPRQGFMLSLAVG